MADWAFAIDVGGTFTDGVGRAPDGSLRVAKVLSSGATKGRADGVVGPAAIVDRARAADPEGFWQGYQAVLLDPAGAPIERRRVVASEHGSGRLDFERPFEHALQPGAPYELVSGEPAPLLCIRALLGIGLGEPLPPLALRLGTTRGTNALLARRGARTALLTTRGLGDLLLIGTGERPHLFELAIRKRAPLFERAFEIDERVDADGRVRRAPDPQAVRALLEEARADGMESLAICFLHGFAHPDHERSVAALAREAGFRHVSVSSEVAPLERIVWRADTTVLDAYLDPVLRAYVADLSAALGRAGLAELAAARFRVMTSSGGLVDARHFRGKDSILSGPAGGVVGYARAALAAGFGRSIGLDMGGTSTDVSRFDGRFEQRFETEKAGVRVLSPTLAIETVAAGGGSVCRFDGVKLVVGPDSAGADPGPACYGRGGPLTITDCNLVLGRILPDRFPFPLDRNASLRRLEALGRAVAAAGAAETPLGPPALAEGLVAIADTTMVRAIRAVSVHRGHDPSNHVLVCFGGAAGQHACSVARELDIASVLVPRRAAVLSAEGLLHAEVRRFAERAVLRPYSDAELAALEALFEELSTRARRDVLADGVAPERLRRPLRWLDLRYQGLDTTLTIAAPERGSWAEAYEREHERLFGYRHAGRPLEIAAARVELAEAAEPLSPPAAPPPTKRRRAEMHAPVHHAGGEVPAGIFAGDALDPGDEVDGPALIADVGTTVFVEPGWRARLTAQGDLLLSRQTGAPATEPARSAAPDPVRLEIFHQKFASIAEQMGIVLERTATSTNIKERRDFSCALFTATGDLVVNAPHIPVHLGAMSETIRAVLADHPDLRPGDVIVTNDPYRGGSHLPDITVVTPIFGSPRIDAPEAAGPTTGQLLFFVASRAHHADVGGIVPGSMPPFSRSLAEEGVLLRSFRLFEGDRPRLAELAALLRAGPWPARDVSSNLADLTAQLAANRTGAAALHELCGRHSREVVLAYMRHIQDAAAARMRAALAGLPPGTRRFVDHLDDGTPIAVAITLEPGRAVVDFAGTGPVVPGNLNANRAIVTAAVLYCFRCLLAEDVPLNGGVLEPLEIRIPAGSLLDPPGAPDPAQAPAVGGGNVETSQRLVDVILGALGLAAASQGTMNNVTFGDATFGYYETLGGGSGATADADGADAVHTHMTNTRLTDPEVLERRYPVRLVRFAIRRGSGGRGRRRGGDGLVRELELCRPLRIALLSERRGPYAPYGLAGGRPGALGRNWIWRAGAPGPEELGGKVELEAAAGDRLIIETPGGGGFGEP